MTFWTTFILIPKLKSCILTYWHIDILTYWHIDIAKKIFLTSCWHSEQLLFWSLGSEVNKIFGPPSPSRADIRTYRAAFGQPKIGTQLKRHINSVQKILGPSEVNSCEKWNVISHLIKKSTCKYILTLITKTIGILVINAINQLIKKQTCKDIYENACKPKITCAAICETNFWTNEKLA